MVLYLAAHVHIVGKLLKMNPHNYLYYSEISTVHQKIMVVVI